ncbi:unnamed protein product [Rotaria magnacalcarata]|uniref:Uncharacterized protein n=1 Tax=Rotaria magnacalcarata TaxID=392030 RepID=A0A815TQH3_9BILA|nr:unnamed protein product [Rotaria magnacalcarata]
MNNSNNNDNLPPGGGGGMGPPPDVGPIQIASIQRNLVLYSCILLFLFGFFGRAASMTIFLRQSLRSILTSCLLHCLSSRLFRREFFNLKHCEQHRRVGVVTQMLDFEESQTQTQLYHLEGEKSKKA